MRLGILAILEAKPGQESAVAELLVGAEALARKETGTVTWYAFRIGPRRFGIFDTFKDEAGRNAHLSGPIAQALMAKADQLLASPPDIQKVDVLATK